jgi:hypothetical protein
MNRDEKVNELRASKGVKSTRKNKTAIVDTRQRDADVNADVRCGKPENSELTILTRETSIRGG